MALLRGELRAADRADAYNPQRWRRLADLGITQGDVPLALTCAEQAGDLSLSLLLYSCVGDRAALAALAARAAAQEQLNIAFLALYLTGDVHGCIELLQAHGKLPEAAFFALAYQPSQIAQAFAVWQADLRAHHHVAAELIANPREYAEYFAGYEEALALEAQLAPLRAMDVKASEYPKYRRMVDGEGIDVSALESVRGDVKTEEVKGGKEEMKTEEVKEEEKDERKDAPPSAEALLTLLLANDTATLQSLPVATFTAWRSADGLPLLHALILNTSSAHATKTAIRFLLSRGCDLNQDVATVRLVPPSDV